MVSNAALTARAMIGFATVNPLLVYRKTNAIPLTKM
jgi:hypothetical protein